MNEQRFTIQDGKRIDDLMERRGMSHSTTPRHPADIYGVLDRYGIDTCVFDVTSALARFLMRKNALRDGQKIGVDRQRYFTQYTIDVAQVWESAWYYRGYGAKLWRISRIAVG